MVKVQGIREKKGLSKAELARKAGIALSYLHEVEQCTKSPTVRTLEKIAAALGVSVTDLLDDEKLLGKTGT